MMTLVQRLLMLDYYAARIVQGLCNGRVSVCPSVCPSMDISYSRRAAALLLSAGSVADIDQ